MKHTLQVYSIPKLSDIDVYRYEPSGAYTTTRTLDGASSLLLWERHMARLSESLSLLHQASPHLYPHLREGIDVKKLVLPSIAESLAKSIELRRAEEEINLTVLLCGSEKEQAQVLFPFH